MFLVFLAALGVILTVFIIATVISQLFLQALNLVTKIIYK